MSDETPTQDAQDNGHTSGPKLLGQIGLLLFEGDVLRLHTGTVPLDIAERMCYGAMKFLDRELTARRLAAILDAPKIEIPRGPLPRRLS